MYFSQALLGTCWWSGAALTVNTAGAAVERVMDEEITVHTEDAVAGRTAEHLRTQTQVCLTGPCPVLPSAGGPN